MVTVLIDFEGSVVVLALFLFASDSETKHETAIPADPIHILPRYKKSDYFAYFIRRRCTALGNIFWVGSSHPELNPDIS